MKRFAPAAERNTGPIIDVLSEFMPESGLVVEVASGTGQHALAFARAFTGLSIQPTEVQAEGRQSIEAHREESGRENLLPALALDVTWREWPIEAADVLIAINMVHISPWAATLGLLAGAQRILPNGGVLYLYGPYLVDGKPTTESNATFDASLRRRNPEWGIRDLQTVTETALEHGLTRVHVAPMPANNFSLVFKKTA